MKLTPLCCLFLVLLPCSVIAQTTYQQSIPDVLTVWSSPIAANPDVLTQQQMLEQNKVNAAQALATLPGIVMQKSGNRNEYTLKVRGFDSRQVPVFFDGIPTYVPYDGNLDLARFTTNDLASIEVNKGYTSLLQGPNLMGGAINITTATPRKPLEGHIAYSQGFARGADYAHNMSARLGARTEYGFIQISGSQLQQRFTPIPNADENNNTVGTHGRRSHSATDDKRGMIKVGWTPRASDEYTLTYVKQDGNKNSPPNSDPNAKGRYKYWAWPDYNKESYYYSGVTQLTDSINLQSRAYHDKFENTLYMYPKKGNRVDYSHYDDHSTGAALQFGIDMEESDLLSFAVHWKDDVHRAQKEKNGDWVRFKDRTWSLATEYQWVVSNDLDVVGAISYDWRKSIDTDKKADNNKQNAINWEIMAKYSLANDDNIRFTISDRSRFPTQKERYTTEKPKDGSRGIINPNLDPERALSFDMTYEGYLNEKWGYQTSLYYNRVSDAIMAHTLYRHGEALFQNQNSGRVDYLGLDIGTKGKMTDWLELGLNYSYIHSDPKQVDHIEGLPKHKAYMWLTFIPVEQVRFTIMEEAQSWTYNRIDENNKLAGYTKTDLRLDYDVGYGISVNASINNLFDKSYQYTQGYIEDGRNYWLGAEYKL
ncbi:TonB-dependent receptor [Proteus mirabilis]|nr:TonB-dependent receptor [Proteus mirabilis]